jgi:hypothetical protein
MSNAANKLIQAAAGNAGEAVYVDDVFSTYLYDGTGSSLEINNGMDLSGEGGLVWIKGRTAVNATQDHRLVDTERGVNEAISSSTNDNVLNITGEFTSFDNDGFTLASTSGNGFNRSGEEYCSWTFRNQPGFFEVVKYEGNGTAGRTVSHNLGSAPGCIIVKRVESGQSNGDFFVYHRGNTASPETDYLLLNSSNATADSTSAWNDTAPTATNFTLGSSSDVNASSNTYIAYLFAHDDQSFGEYSDEAIIKCDSFTTDGSGNATVDLGFEPQWLLWKASSAATDWFIHDTMRKFTVEGVENLKANTSDAASSGTAYRINSTGFEVVSAGANQTRVYVAIRRPHKPASDFAATKLFNVDAGANTTPGFETGFPVDMGIFRIPTSTSDFDVMARLTNLKRLDITTGAEGTKGTMAQMDHNDGWSTSANTYLGWAWRRAPDYFDVTLHTSNGQPTQQITHNLGVAPEMAWIKIRSTTGGWFVYHKDLSAGKNCFLNTDAAETTSNTTTAATFTSTYWTPGDDGYYSGGSNTQTYIAYLFATVAGISKVGIYTGTGSDLNVDCGFSAGSSFILIKRKDSTGDWYLYDSVQGIVAGNDPYLLMNSSAAQVTSTDYIDPLSSGFTVTSSAPAGLNASGGTYIFYAIA